jgi:hypothetical protein
MAITNPEAIKFTDEQIRPMAESVRGLKVRIDAAATKWLGGMSAIVGSKAEDTIEDKRDADGVSRLTSADVVAVMTQLLAIQNILDQGGVAGVIEKPCVRAIGVN